MEVCKIVFRAGASDTEMYEMPLHMFINIILAAFKINADITSEQEGHSNSS